MTATERQPAPGWQDALAAAWQGLEPDTARAALAVCEPMRLGRGEVYTGAGTGRICLVSSGRLSIYFQRPDNPEASALAALIGPGNFFSAGIDPSGRITAAQARTKVRFLAMSYEDAYALAAAHPDFNRLVLTVLAAMAYELGRRVESLLLGDATGRVAWMLDDLLARFGHQANDGLELRHRVTQGELAKMCGVTRETVNKTISEFVGQGWVSMRGHSIVVHDRDALRRLAG